MASKPPFYLKINAQYPQVIAAVESLGEALSHAGPLDPKTVQLVQLAAAAAVHSEGAVHSHVRRALAGGASEEEVRHALLSLTSTIGFPNVTAALSWAEDVLDQAHTPKV
jgi:4-carboxymuconolactone decarboxylase